MASKPIFVAEVASARNNSLHHGATGQLLRGRWTASHVARNSMHAALAAISEIPVIPGIRIVIDCENRVCRLEDPLGTTDEGRAIWKQVKTVLDHYKGMLGPDGMQPMETKVYPNATDDELKNWLYWLRREVDAGYVEFLPALSTVKELPPLDKIRALPGRRVRSPFDSRALSDDRKYTDCVPAVASKQPATA